MTWGKFKEIVESHKVKDEDKLLDIDTFFPDNKDILVLRSKDCGDVSIITSE